MFIVTEFAIVLDMMI